MHFGLDAATLVIATSAFPDYLAKAACCPNGFIAARTPNVLSSHGLALRRAGSAPRPAPGDLVLLAYAGLVLEPDLYGYAFREGCPDLCQLGSEAPFLKASIACSFWACGGADAR